MFLFPLTSQLSGGWQVDVGGTEESGEHVKHEGVVLPERLVEDADGLGPLGEHYVNELVHALFASHLMLDYLTLVRGEHLERWRREEGGFHTGFFVRRGGWGGGNN